MQLPLAAVFVIALDRSAATFLDGVLNFGRSKVEEPRLICNQRTAHACECTRCHETVSVVDGPWIVVQFEGCHYAKVNELRIRESVAHWVELQCAWTVRCPRRKERLNATNVFIGGIRCAEDGHHSSMQLAVLYDSSQLPTNGNSFDAQVVGSAIQAHEHMLSLVLNAELMSVTELRQTQDDMPGTEKPGSRDCSHWHLVPFAVLSFTTSFITSFFLLCIVLLGYVSWRTDWKCLARGRWHRPRPSVKRPIILSSTSSDLVTSFIDDDSSVDAIPLEDRLRL